MRIDVGFNASLAITLNVELIVAPLERQQNTDCSEATERLSTLLATALGRPHNPPPRIHDLLRPFSFVSYHLKYRTD